MLQFTLPAFYVTRREDNDQWVLDAKLDGHTDWVRDVAWAPSIGLPVTRIASCSQDCKVIVWRRDEQESGQWTPQVCFCTLTIVSGGICKYVCTVCYVRMQSHILLVRINSMYMG